MGAYRSSLSGAGWVMIGRYPVVWCLNRARSGLDGGDPLPRYSVPVPRIVLTVIDRR